MAESNWRESLQTVKRDQLAARGHFESDPEVQAMIEALTHSAAGLKRGDTLSWERVTEVIGLTRQDARFWVVVNAWRKRLRKNFQIETWCLEANRGVTLLDHQGNIEIVAKKRTMKAARQSRKVLAAIENTDRRELTPKQMLMAHHFAERAKEALRRVKVEKAAE